MLHLLLESKNHKRKFVLLMQKCVPLLLRYATYSKGLIKYINLFKVKCFWNPHQEPQAITNMQNGINNN